MERGAYGELSECAVRGLFYVVEYLLRADNECSETLNDSGGALMES
jgi:hypothetical protein